MKKSKLLLAVALLCFSMLLISNIAVAQEDADEETGGLIDVLSEIWISLLIALIGVAGLIFLIVSTKDVGGAVGSGFNFIKIGYVFFISAFLLHIISEIGGSHESQLVEFIFEGLMLLGLIFIVVGPKLVADKLKQ